MSTIKKRLDWAFANEENPKAQAYIGRYRSGLLNPELQAEGMNPVPLPSPQIDVGAAFEAVEQIPAQQVQTRIPTPGQEFDFQGGEIPTITIMETGETIELPAGTQEDDPIVMKTVTEKKRQADFRADVSKAGTELVGDFTERGQNVVDILKTDQDPFSKALQLVGQVAGGAVDIAERGVQAAVTAILPPELEEAVMQKLQALLDTEGGKMAAEAIGGGLEKWNEFKESNPTLAANIEAALPIAELLTIGVGGPIVAKGVKETVETVLEKGAEVVEKVGEAAEPIIEKGVEVIKETGEAVIKKGEEALEARKIARAEKIDTQIDEAVGRIIQGKPEDIEAARRAIQNIDTEGVETFKDLNVRVNENITSLAKKVDEELSKHPDLIPADQFVKTTKVGDKDVTQEPLKEALDGLENAYKKSGEEPNAERISQLRTKFETEGFTVKEANDLAREYGVEFRDRAFTKLGDPKAGFNAENFENVRKGVKDVVRDKLPDTTTKELDAQMADLFSTRNLTVKMEEKVNTLFQKVKKRGLFKRASQAIGTGVDVATFGTISGFMSRFLPSQVGLKTMNSLDIEEELIKNLKLIDKLGDKATDDEILDVLTKVMKQ